jgi:glutaredoxin 3
MTMRKVTVYTTTYCPYCVRAKSYLSSQNIPFTEVNLEDKPDELQALKKRTGLRTVPQIFFGEELIGGCDDLLALGASGKLQEKLGA